MLSERLGAHQHPYLRVLGPVELHHAQGTVDPRRVGRLTEYLAFLLLTPGATYSAIDEAIWPGRPADKDTNNNTRGTATSRLRRWLGKNEADEDYFPPYSSYRISEDVQTDWDEFTRLVGSNVSQATTEDLEKALGLVQGRPFKGVPARRYAWAEMIRQRMIAQISDASYELGHRRLFESDWQGVEEAVTVGIEVDPGTERLWRLRILAAHQSGNLEAFREAVDRLEAFGDELGIGLDPETEDLLAALNGEMATFAGLIKNNLDPHPMENR